MGSRVISKKVDSGNLESTYKNYYAEKTNFPREDFKNEHRSNSVSGSVSVSRPDPGSKVSTVISPKLHHI